VTGDARLTRTQEISGHRHRHAAPVQRIDSDKVSYISRRTLHRKINEMNAAKAQAKSKRKEALAFRQMWLSK